MSLTLSSRDLDLLAKTQRQLLSPLTYPEPSDWSRAVSGPAKRLLQAERGGMILPDGDRLLCPDDGYDEQAVSAYPELTDEMHRRYGFLARTTRLGAYDRTLAWGPHLPAYYRSAYYNEFIVPNRFFGMLGLAEPLGDVVDVHHVAQLVLHRDGEGEGDSERDLALLRLMLPAFRAGVRLWRQSATLRGELDHFSDAIFLIRRDGGVEHRNRAASRLLASEETAATIEVAVQQLARTVAVLDTGYGEPRELAVAARNGASSTRYLLSASRVCDGRFGADVVAMVCVQDVRPTPPTSQQLRERHDLTSRQVEVALLLARRLRNEEIAETLGISPHTAKRHTEAVLMKLGVTSRTEVEAALLAN